MLSRRIRGYNRRMPGLSSRRAPRLASFVSLFLIAGVGLSACKSKDEAPSTEALELIPAEVQGIYGRTAEDAPGMEVTATGLRFDQMQLTIHEGKMEGGTVRIERATLEWEKLEPKTCNGTLARQGDRLLMTLYDSENTEAKCESTLEAEWHRWEQLESLPEMIQGRYGSLLVEPGGMRLDIEWVHAQMKAGVIRALPGNNDERAELLIKQATVEGEGEDGAVQTFECMGTMKLEEGRLHTDFWVPPARVPEPGTDEAAKPEVQARVAANEEACDAWDGHARKWEVDLSALPSQPIRSGELRLSVSPDKKVVLESPDLRCEQELWRTESVDSRGGWNAQVGGERMTLARAEPTAVSKDCALKLRIWCEVQEGGDPGAIDPSRAPAEHVAACMDLTQHDLCPDTLTVRAISSTRFKVHVEPPSFNAIACVDPTGEFGY